MFILDICLLRLVIFFLLYIFLSSSSFFSCCYLFSLLNYFVNICLIFYYFVEFFVFYLISISFLFFFLVEKTYLSHFHLFPFTFFGLLYLRSRLSSSMLLNPVKPRGLTSREPAGQRTNSNNSHVSSTTRPFLKDNKAVRR